MKTKFKEKYIMKGRYITGVFYYILALIAMLYYIPMTETVFQYIITMVVLALCVIAGNDKCKDPE